MNKQEIMEKVNQALDILSDGEVTGVDGGREAFKKLQEVHARLRDEVDRGKLTTCCLSCLDLTEIVRLMCQNQKIEAIKVLRIRTGMSLKAAKEQIDVMWEEISALMDEQSFETGKKVGWEEGYAAGKKDFRPRAE